MNLKPFTLFVVLMSTALLGGCGYNSLQGLDEDVKAAWSDVENQYQRRSDLIPNLVNTVKGYATHEKDTLQAVIEARSKATQTTIDASKLSDPAAVQKFQEAQQGVSSALSRLLVVAENYPQLKANENFKDLQVQLEGTENRITVARRRYIESVATFNKAVRSFPTNLTARFLLHLEPKQTFSISEEAKQAPKVQF